MKTCPICNAIAFDDATTCFGCMHRFEPDVFDVEGSALPGMGGLPSAGDHDGQTVIVDEPLAFLVSLTPMRRGGATTWTCSIETAVI